MTRAGTATATEDRAIDDLATEAWQRIRAISHDPEMLAAGHEVMEEAGLSLGPMKALRFLPLTGSLSMRQLAGLIRCDNSYVTSLVDALEERGLARREAHPTDRRVKVIVLTDEGRSLAERVQRANATPPPAFAALTEAEASTLCDLLRKVDPSED